MFKTKKLIALLAVSAIVACVPNATAITAKAAEAKTYYILYDEDLDEWRSQQSNGSWDESRGTADINYALDRIEDGDLLVVDGCGKRGITLELDLSLQNLTVKSLQGGAVTVKKGITDCYVIGSTSAAVNGNITNAYAYDAVSCNFNNNVTNLSITSSDKLEANVVVLGTVGYAKVTEKDKVIGEGSNFAAGSFHLEKGGMKTEVSNYTPGAARTGAPAAKPAADSDLDDVPKTGDSSSALLLFGLGLASLSGSVLLRKKSM